ncbi:MAG: tetratricopeptide repeat protein [Deltaproteobacteria bacterium]|nr:tetratricopeptide repeat protein [Deltaproteobacteria bacterium]
MEQRFYKVRLTNGRVIGPLDLERVKLFIYKDKITGLEMARLYPTGDWKDINTYPEIADLLMQKLENKLEVDPNALAAAAGEAQGESDGNTKASPDDPIPIQEETKLPDPPPQRNPNTHQTGTPQLNMPEGSMDMNQAAAAAPAADGDSERTMMITADNERTMMVVSPNAAKAASDAPALDTGSEPQLDADGNPVVRVSSPDEHVVVADPFLAAEKTAMLVRPTSGDAAPGGPGAAPGKKKATLADHKKKIVAGAVIVIAAIFMTMDEDKPKSDDSFRITKIELPATGAKPDPGRSEKVFLEGMKAYYQDTVEGYNRAAEVFKAAAALDPNNVRALCMLASSYMNLFDVVDRNATYFNTVTRLIEMERAKGVDLAETVIADVELYHLLGNPDAAFNRIVEFAKTHEWGMDMIYYLALTFYMKGNYAEALQQLNKIEQKDFFSPKISYLYGEIFEKSSQIEDALKAFTFTITKSPKHIKAHVKLAEIYFAKDNMPESGKHADFVIVNKKFASRNELAKAYYFRARMHMVANHVDIALADLEKARTLTPDDQDILLDYYTLKAKHGDKVKNAPEVAKMFYFMAEGEKAMKAENMSDALAAFLSAREAYDKDATPLLRLADVFMKKGDPQSSITNLEKALAIDPKRKEVYPKYIHTLIQGYEFEEALKIIKKFQEQQPEPAVLDRLYGELFLKQEKYPEASTYLKRALEASNFDSSVYVAFGTLMFKTNNFQDAAFYMGLAQRFDPFNVDATVTIGKSIAELDSLEKGVEYVQSMLQMSPHKAALLNGIAEIYARKGKYDDALKFADNALTTDPTYALANRTKGEAFASQNKRKEALDAFETYTNLALLDPTGHIERHKIYLTPDEKGRLDMTAAKGELLKVATQFPRYPGIHFMIGDLLFKAGEIEKAGGECEWEIKNNPGFVPGYVCLATVLNKSKGFQKAVELTNMALKSAPNYPPLLLQAGIANRGMKSYAASQSMLERAIGLDQGNPAIWKELGGIYYDLSKFDQMKNAYKKYLELYPDAPDKGEIEEYLKKIGG